MNEDLLQPSLESSKPVSIFSSGALMAAAFFGGPVAVSIIATLNSASLGRASKEWPKLLAVLLSGVIAAFFIGTYALDGLTDSRSFRLSVRAAGFVSFGLVWLMHMKELRALSALGLDPRSPWVPVISACLFAIVVHGVTITLLREFFSNGF